jgi:hypothetical protein
MLLDVGNLPTTTRRRQASSILPGGTEFGHTAGLGSEPSDDSGKTSDDYLTILSIHRIQRYAAISGTQTLPDCAGNNRFTPRFRFSAKSRFAWMVVTVLHVNPIASVDFWKTSVDFRSFNISAIFRSIL